MCWRFAARIFAAIAAAEYGKALKYLAQEIISRAGKVPTIAPGLIETLRSLVAGIDVDRDACIEPEEDAETEG